ncbi:unnamed protein product [Peronospora destructor]|uniref:Fe2OG dioxygenase domain-containing protein n=1 Tax=Peronospora destructor TaxID=86335 RepID=A0AAV0TX76_9STRA|nr:unnamed protein product [Peronospora destructor]
MFEAEFWDGKWPFGGEELFVNSLGMIAFPLVEEQAEKLIAQCEKSPYGHNMETKINECVRKSWQLEPDQVEIKNPSWEKGLDKLIDIIANRLEYKGVPLQCKLYKVLVYGKGGHFFMHRDTEKEDGMIATLVVQPPSTHEGGVLEVRRNGATEHRHDFGKADGTAAYLPHFAVHYADAEHALDKVTKGFRLAMVYSICLPATMEHLRKGPAWTLDINPYDFSCWGRIQAFHWYTTSGQDLGRWKDEEGGKMRNFNFLNPGGETFVQLWDSFTRSEDIRYTGNEGSIDSTKYSRFAIFAWPAVRHEENMLNVMSAEHAVEDLASRKPVNAPELRIFLDAVSAKFGWGVEDRWRRGAMASVRFCRSFLNLLVDVGDPELAKLFLSKFCPRLGKKKENASLIPGFVKIASTFSWDDVGEALLDVLGTKSRDYDYGEESAVELLLRVAAGLNDGAPRQALLAKAVE